jgi:hypothetical protein
MASSVTRTAVSPANNFDCDPSAASNGLPLRAIHAAFHTSRRAASTATFMSASLKAIPWFSMIARPNCFRCFA